MSRGKVNEEIELVEVDIFGRRSYLPVWAAQDRKWEAPIKTSGITYTSGKK